MSNNSRREKKTKSNAENFDQLENSLRQAQAAIETSQAGIARLHYEWRSHLQRLGGMIVMASLYQLYQPAALCYEEVSEWNNSTKQEWSPTQVALVVVSDSVTFLLAVIAAVLLVRFTGPQHRNLSHPLFLFASAMVPVILALWFWQKQQRPTYDEGVPHCLATNWLFYPNTAVSKGQPGTTIQRDLPVVLVFHVLVSACYLFMSHQRAKQTRNLAAILQLREELQSSKKKR